MAAPRSDMTPSGSAPSASGTPGIETLRKPATALAVPVTEQYALATDEVEKLGSTFTANAQRIRSYENAPKLLRAQYAVVLGKRERPSSTRDTPGVL
jgi:hypothetical protein